MLISSDLSRNQTGWLGPRGKHVVYSKLAARARCWTIHVRLAIIPPRKSARENLFSLSPRTSPPCMHMPRIETDETFTLLHPSKVGGRAGSGQLSAFRRGVSRDLPAAQPAFAAGAAARVGRPVDVAPCGTRRGAWLHRDVRTFPRSFVDLNREPLELDPRLIAGTLRGGGEYALPASRGAGSARCPA